MVCMVSSNTDPVKRMPGFLRQIVPLSAGLPGSRDLSFGLSSIGGQFTPLFSGLHWASLRP